MKKMLAIATCLLLSSSPAVADTGVTKAVKTHGSKAVKSVQSHQSAPQAQEMQKQAEKKAEKHVTGLSSIFQKKSSAPAKQVQSMGADDAKKQVAASGRKSRASLREARAKKSSAAKKKYGQQGACKLTAMTYSNRYGEQLGGHLGRGVINILSGWIELPRITFHRTQEGAPVIGLLTGITEGAAVGILRTASGILDLPSGLVPGYTSELYFHSEPTIGCYRKAES